MKIAASRCQECERAIVPPRRVCPYCGPKSGVMESLELEGRGKVKSFTTLQMPPDGFEPPLTMALVQLDQGAIVLCLANDLDASSLKIGDKVSLSLDSEERFRFQVSS